MGPTETLDALGVEYRESSTGDVITACPKHKGRWLRFHKDGEAACDTGKWVKPCLAALGMSDYIPSNVRQVVPVKASVVGEGLGRLRGLPDDLFMTRKGPQTLSAAQAIMDAIHYGWNPTEGRFYVYGDGLWRPGDADIDKAIFALFGERFRTSLDGHVRRALVRMPGVREVSAEPVGPDRWINVANGLLDWTTGELNAHMPDACGVTQLPVTWDEDAECPVFDAFLRDVVPEDCITSGFIWEVIGYSIYSGNPMQKAFVLMGPGGNGKGRFLHVLGALVGHRNVSSVGLHELVGNRFRAATLYGKLLNVAGDLDSKWLEDTALFKKVTGGDSIQAEHKYGHPFDFVPWATPFYSVNKPFGSADTSEGYWRRWIVLPFPFNHRDSTRTADEIDRANTTPEELTGILRHAVAGLRVLMERGRFIEPKSVVEAKDKFRTHGDWVRGWLKECAVLAPKADTKRTILYSSFCEFTEGDHQKPMRAAEFYARLDQLEGVHQVTVKGDRFFRGIKPL